MPASEFSCTHRHQTPLQPVLSEFICTRRPIHFFCLRIHATAQLHASISWEDLVNPPAAVGNGQAKMLVKAGLSEVFEALVTSLLVNFALVLSDRGVLAIKDTKS